MCSLLRRPTIHRVAVAARSILLKVLALTWRLKHQFGFARQSHSTLQTSLDLCQCTIEVNVSPVHEQVLPGRMA